MVATGRFWICIAISLVVVATGVFCLNDSPVLLYKYRVKQHNNEANRVLDALQNSTAYRNILLSEAASWLNNTSAMPNAKTASAKLLIVRNGLARLGITPDEKELRTYFSDWSIFWDTLPKDSAHGSSICGNSIERSNDSNSIARLQLLADDVRTTDPNLTAAVDFLRQVDSPSSVTMLSGSCSVEPYATALAVSDYNRLPICCNPLNRIAIVSQAELVAVEFYGPRIHAYSRQMSFTCFFSMLGALCGTFGIFSRNFILVLGCDPGYAFAEILADATGKVRLCFCSIFPNAVCRLNSARFETSFSSYEKNLSSVVLLI